MEKHYKTLGLKESASQEEIKTAYERLSKELDPKNNDNQDFFKEEYDKVQEAYEALYNSSILATEKGAKKNISDTKAPEVKKQNEKTLQFQKKSSKREFVFGGFLFFITIGIWGIFVLSDDYTQRVILTKEYTSEKLSISLVQKFSTLMPVSCINVSPNKKFIAIADETEDPLGFKELKETFKISILNSKTYLKKLELKGHLASIEAINFNYDSKYLVSSDQSGVIIIWDLSNGKQITKIETSEWIHNVKFSNLGNEIIAIQGFEKRALIYDTNGKLKAKIDVGKQINDFEYNPITNQIYFGCYDELQVWSFLSRKKLNSLPFSGLMCMQFNHDYSQFAIGKSNGNIVVMSPKLQEVNRLVGHFKPVLSVSYSLDNSKLASASSDQTARIWEIKKQNELIQLVNEHNGTVNSIQYISDKNDFITGGENKELKIWK